MTERKNHVLEHVRVEGRVRTLPAVSLCGAPGVHDSLEMSLPDGTIAYDADQVVLAGDMSPEEVSACVGAGVKSWLYLNDAGHAKNPSAHLGALPFEVMPLASPAALTPAFVDKLVDHVAAAPKPLLIQCSTATRAGIPFILAKARAEKLGASSALQAARTRARIQIDAFLIVR